MIRLDSCYRPVTSPWCVVALACLAVAACTDAPTVLDERPDNELAVASAKGGNKPPQQSDVPAAFDQFFGRVASDRPVPGDAFVDDVDYVKASIESDGRAWLRTFNGAKRQEVVRRLCVDLSDMKGTPTSQSDWDAFVEVVSTFDSNLDLTTDLLCVAATLHTRDHSNGGNKMLDMLVNEERYSGGKIALTELGSRRNSWEWRLIFDTYQGPVPGEGVCITRLTEKTWTLATGCNAAGQAIDDVVELWRNNGGLAPVADFNMAFTLTITTEESP